MASVNEPSLLERWLTHYTKLGVDIKRRAAVLFEVSAQDTDALVAASVEVAQRWGLAHSITKDGYSSQKKNIHANRYIKNLPDHAWIMYTDLDELVKLE